VRKDEAAEIPFFVSFDNAPGNEETGPKPINTGTIVPLHRRVEDRDGRAEIDEDSTAPFRFSACDGEACEFDIRRIPFGVGDVKNAIEATSVDDRFIHAGAREDELVRDVEVTRSSGVLVDAGDRQDIVPGRHLDHVFSRKCVRLLDRSAQGAAPDRGGANPVPGECIDLIDRGVDLEGPRLRE